MDEIKEALSIRNDPYFTANTKVALFFRGRVVSLNAHLWNPRDLFVILVSNVVEIFTKFTNVDDEHI